MQKHRMLLIGGWHSVWSKFFDCDLEVFLLAPKGSISSEERDVLNKNKFNLIESDFSNIFFTLHLISEINQTRPLQSSFVFKEEHLLLAAILNSTLGITGVSFESVMLTKNKAATRKSLDAANANTVAWGIIDSMQQLKDFRRTHGKFIIKPIEGVDSRGVELVSEDRDLNTIDFFNQDLLMEKYIEGQDYSVECLSFNGEHHILGVTSETNAGAPNFYEIDHFFPAPELKKADLEKIHSQVKKYISALKVDNCLSHTEIRFDGSDAHLIESHTRMGGDRVWLLVELAMNHSPIQQLARALSGKKINFSDISPQRTVAIRGMIQKCDGRVQEYLGIDEARSAPEVVDIIINKQPGTIVNRTATTTGKLLYAIVAGDDASTLDDRLEFALSKISVQCTPD